ncbi:sigma-70 family RNA polymerase sigma factor [Porticoccaceae bacterium LTM1]|nr:sigma-70 family RNA polymerase sigma factor [Porticoccaceae bacterium LTM1]
MAFSRPANVVYLTRGKENNTEALDRLYKEHANPLRGMFNASMCGSPDVEDVIQDVFTRLSTMEDLAEKFPKGKKGVRSFLFAMANNLIIDMVRATRVRVKYVQNQMGEQELVEGVIPLESKVEAEYELELIKASLLSMNEQWRDAFILNRFKHFSYREVAEVMGVSVKAVEKYISKALLVIKGDLKAGKAGAGL